MYVIGYIGDDLNEIDHFKRRIKRFNKSSPKKIQLKIIDLNINIKDDILMILKDSEIQGIIIDHMLNEKGIVPFQGSHIKNQIMAEINDFPTIILTNDIRDAENHSNYVHNVYAKKNEKNIDHSYDGTDDEIEVKLRKDFPILIRLLKDIDNFKEKTKAWRID